MPLRQGDGFVEDVERLAGDKRTRVVVYCTNEECDASPKAARKLEAAGFERVLDYTGGVEAWERAGLPLEGSAAL